jgi:hypothetical protein
MKKPQQPDAERREFLHTAKSAGLVGAAFALMSRIAPATAAPAEEPQATAEEPQQRGYHESEHIRKYYAQLRRM